MIRIALISLLSIVVISAAAISGIFNASFGMQSSPLTGFALGMLSPTEICLAILMIWATKRGRKFGGWAMVIILMLGLFAGLSRMESEKHSIDQAAKGTKIAVGAEIQLMNASIKALDASVNRCNELKADKAKYRTGTAEANRREPGVKAACGKSLDTAREEAKAATINAKKSSQNQIASQHAGFHSLSKFIPFVDSETWSLLFNFLMMAVIGLQAASILFVWSEQRPGTVLAIHSSAEVEREMAKVKARYQASLVEIQSMRLQGKIEKMKAKIEAPKKAPTAKVLPFVEKKTIEKAPELPRPEKQPEALGKPKPKLVINKPQKPKKPVARKRDKYHQIKDLVQSGKLPPKTDLVRQRAKCGKADAVNIMHRLAEEGVIQKIGGRFKLVKKQQIQEVK